MYVYRYQNRTQPFYGGPVNRGLHGLGSSEADAWGAFADSRAASGYSGSADAAFAAAQQGGGGGGGGGGSSFADTVSSIGKALSPIATSYFASKAPRQTQRTTFVTTAASPTSEGMSSKTKLILGGVAAVLVVLFLAKRGR
jgi:hypothetical protein